MPAQKRGQQVAAAAFAGGKRPRKPVRAWAPLCSGQFPSGIGYSVCLVFGSNNQSMAYELALSSYFLRVTEVQHVQAFTFNRRPSKSTARARAKRSTRSTRERWQSACAERGS